MFRPHLTKSTKQLLQIARSPSCTKVVLEEIMNELAQRKNDHAFYAIFEIGKLLENAQDKELQQQIKEKERFEAYSFRRNQEGFFEWPSTNAPASTHGYTGDVFFYKDGLLSYVGYRVGHVQGVSTEVRQQILDCVFHNQLPRVQSPEYMREWGDPKTAVRLRKLANAIATFTKNAKKKKDGDFSDAISDWEYDLRYLFLKYYVGVFRFAWPDE